MDVFFLMSSFRLYQRFKMSFEDNSVRKNLFLKACFCWDSRLSLREVDQNFKFGGTIGYGDSYLEFLIRHFKVFRLHAILHDAAWAVRAEKNVIMELGFSIHGKVQVYSFRPPKITNSQNKRFGSQETFTKLC